MRDPLNPDAAQIAQHYRAALDSCNLVNRTLEIAAKAGRALTADEDDAIYRNVQHLKIMRGKPFWTTENMQHLDDAIHAGDPMGKIL